MMALRNPSTEGDEMSSGEEPEIADGVRGVWFDIAAGIFIPLLYASKPGNGDVGRMLDQLPQDRLIVFVEVLSPQLAGMLQRRGFNQATLDLNDGNGAFSAIVRRPIDERPSEPATT